MPMMRPIANSDDPGSRHYSVNAAECVADQYPTPCRRLPVGGARP